MLQIKTNNPSGHNVSICNTYRLPPYPSERLREPSSSLPMVRHI